jgi:multiple sugar transport system permease protein
VNVRTETTTGSGHAAPAQAAPRRRSTGDLRAAMVFLLPATFGFVVFYLWPTVRGFYLSLTEYNLLEPPQFIGLDNYQRLVQDPLFWNSIRVTLLYVVMNIGLQTVLALGLAMLMYRLTQSSLVRGVVLLPYLIANVIVALVWYWMLDVQLGIVNSMPTIALINVWRHLGYTALLIFAGLQTIPHTVYEAAAIDGAGEWRTFWRITVPLLRPVLVMVLVLTMIGSFQIFDTIAVTTQGGPVNATRAIYFYIYEQAFTRFAFGYASALSVVLFLILSGVAIAQMRLLRADQTDVN